MKQKHYFITGCAGFIASRVCDFLLNQGHRVTGVDNLNTYYDVQVKAYRLDHLKKSKGFSFHHLDIENLDGLSSLFKGIQLDAVLNLAARAGVRYSMENPHVYMTTNAHGTLNLLEMCKAHNINKFLLASTSSLYAGLPMPFTEDLPVNTPISPYAASKKSAEMMAHAYHKLYGIDVSVVRYFTVFGPAGRPDMSIFRFIKWIDEGSAITLFGDGSQSRDWTFVDDIAEGTIAAAEAEVGYEIMNLGGGCAPISLKYIIERIEQGLGKKAIIDQKPFHQADMKDTWADISKAKHLLNWEPKISPQAGIARTIKWHNENRQWVKHVSV